MTGDSGAAPGAFWRACGFDNTVNAGDAWMVISSLPDRIDDGFHSKALFDALKALDRTNHLVGRTMGPLDQVAPAEPAEKSSRSAPMRLTPGMWSS